MNFIVLIILQDKRQIVTFVKDKIFMISIEPKELSTKDLHGYLLSSVGPRPIALASTIDKENRPNLSPFSFFNVFSANPPIAIFSPARRVRNNTTKHTLENILHIKEVVINVVPFSIVEQCSLSSSEYGPETNEFKKSGLTAIPSDLILPFRVKESPVQMECKVNEIIALGNQGGAGNLVVCEIIKIHIDESILGTDRKIDPHKLDLVGRMGANWYCRASGDSIFEVEKPNTKLGIGFDALPNSIKNSTVLSGNDLAKLANIHSFTESIGIDKSKENSDIAILFKSSSNKVNARKELHRQAKILLAKNNITEAWKILLIDKLNNL